MKHFPERASLARDERGAEVIETALLLACSLRVHVLHHRAGQKIVGRWNAIDIFFGAA